MSEFRRGTTADDVAMGERIRIRRRLLGMSQDELGASLGVSRQQIQKYERAKDRLSGARLAKVAAVLKTDTNTLVANGAKVPQSTRLIEHFLASHEGAAIAKYFAVLDLPTRRAIVQLAKSLAGAKD